MSERTRASESGLSSATHQYLLRRSNVVVPSGSGANNAILFTVQAGLSEDATTRRVIDSQAIASRPHVAHGLDHVEGGQRSEKLAAGSISSSTCPVPKSGQLAQGQLRSTAQYCNWN